MLRNLCFALYGLTRTKQWATRITVELIYYLSCFRGILGIGLHRQDDHAVVFMLVSRKRGEKSNENAIISGNSLIPANATYFRSLFRFGSEKQVEKPNSN